MFLSGNRDGVIVSVQQVSIHGTIMVDVAFPLEKRNPGAQCTDRPRGRQWCFAPGAAVVTFLMNVVTGIRVIS